VRLPTFTNTGGKKSFLLTAAALSLAAVLIRFLLANVTIGPVVFGPVDSVLVLAVLAPTFVAYVGGKHPALQAPKE